MMTQVRISAHDAPPISARLLQEINDSIQATTRLAHGYRCCGFSTLEIPATKCGGKNANVSRQPHFHRDQELFTGRIRKQTALPFRAILRSSNFPPE